MKYFIVTNIGPEVLYGMFSFNLTTASKFSHQVVRFCCVPKGRKPGRLKCGDSHERVKIQQNSRPIGKYRPRPSPRGRRTCWIFNYEIFFWQGRWKLFSMLGRILYLGVVKKCVFLFFFQKQFLEKMKIFGKNENFRENELWS